MHQADPPARIAYLAGEYPKVSHTFILREIAALRVCGIDVLPCSIRQTGTKDLTGPEERAEAALTFNVLTAARNPLRLLGDHLRMLISGPGRYFEALRLAWRIRPPGLRALVYQFFYFAEAAVLASELKRREIRHLHNHFAASSCTVAMLSSVMSSIPYSFTLHGPADFFEAEKWRLDEKIARAAFVSCISFFSRSQGMMYSDQSHWPKLHIIHCGIEAERYPDVAPSEIPGKRLIFVGRLAAVKGIPMLVEAFASLKASHDDLTLMLVGDGNGRAWAEARVAELGLTGSVTFTGYQSQGEVAAHLAASDIFVLPSFAEGVPVVLMEAMASRLPVVTTRIAGIPELVEDGASGFVVAPGDAQGLASRIGTLLDDPGLCARMGDLGRARVLVDFNIADEGQRLKKILDCHILGAENPGLRPDLPQ